MKIVDHKIHIAVAVEVCQRDAVVDAELIGSPKLGRLFPVEIAQIAESNNRQVKIRIQTAVDHLVLGKCFLPLLRVGVMRIRTLPRRELNSRVPILNILAVASSDEEVLVAIQI